MRRLGGAAFLGAALPVEYEVDGTRLHGAKGLGNTVFPCAQLHHPHPSDKLVVSGLVTTKRVELESKDELKRRIEEASKYVAIEQLCLSPQCGFSSTVEGNTVTYEQEVAKLRVIVETAAEVWG